MRLSPVLLIAAVPLSGLGQTATFIGNCAFRIELGAHVIYSDFPYQSGYSGYDTYSMPDGFSSAKGTALITHAHRDHFDSLLFRSCSLQLISPDQKEADRSAGLAAMKASGIEVQLSGTPHAEIPHFSYVVSWKDHRLYFSGDTEDPAHLLATKDIDVAFVTPWLIDAVKRAGRSIDTKTLVVYHHQRGEFDGRDLKSPCGDCRVLIPQQGDVIDLFP
ncbi:MAG: hypothetical protein WAU70_07610 [Flavobacteriales bacterium]